MGDDLRRSDHRDGHTGSSAASFDHGQHSRGELPPQRTPQSGLDSFARTTPDRTAGCHPERSGQTEPIVMSFLRHGQIYQSDVFFIADWRRSCFRLRPRPHRLDEFAASYSLAGWSPPEPTSALPAGFIVNPPAETFNHLLRRVAYFSTGRMGNFQPVLTEHRT